MKLIIAGSRSVGSYMEKRRRIQLSLSEVPCIEQAWKECGFDGKVTEIVSGTAYGADKLGEQLGEKLDIPVKQFPADWNSLGRAAGPIRNKQMGDYADCALIFMSKNSRGAKHMYTYMKSLKKPVFLFIVKDNEILERSFEG